MVREALVVEDVPQLDDVEHPARDAAADAEHPARDAAAAAEAAAARREDERTIRAALAGEVSVVVVTPEKLAAGGYFGLAISLMEQGRLSAIARPPRRGERPSRCDV
jgi:hypothetical protein